MPETMKINHLTYSETEAHVSAHATPISGTRFKDLKLKRGWYQVTTVGPEFARNMTSFHGHGGMVDLLQACPDDLNVVNGPVVEGVPGLYWQLMSM